MKKEPFLQVSKRRNKARWQERLLIRFIRVTPDRNVCGKCTWRNDLGNDPGCI